MAKSLSIKVRIVVDDKPAAAGLNKVDRRIDKTARRAKKAGNSISRIFGTAFAAIGGTAVFGMAAKGIIGVHTEVQNAEGAIASLISALMKVPISDGLAHSRKMVQLLNDDAAKGVGALEHYTGAFQMLLAPATAAGASLEQVRDLTKQSLTAGFAIQGTKGLKFGPMDIVQALGKGLNGIITPVANRVVETTGMDADAFNKLSTAKRMEVLMKGFGNFEAGAALMGQSFDAQADTFTDKIKKTVRVMTVPLFNRWTNQLKSINLWFERNEKKIERIADVWGPRLVSMWDTLIKKAGTYAAIIAGASLMHIAQPGGFSMPKKGAISGFFGKGVMGVGGGIMGAIKGVLGSITRVAGPVAVLALAFTALQGAIYEYPALLAMLGYAGMELMGALSSLGTAFGSLTGQGSLLNLVGGFLLITLTGLTHVLTFVVKIVATVVEVFGMLFALLGNMLKILWGFISFGWGKVTGGDTKEARKLFEGSKQAQRDRTSAGVEAIKEIWRGARDAASKADAAKGMPNAALAPLSNNTTNINVNKVNVTVRSEVNADPARVATAFDVILSDLQRAATQAKRRPISVLG